MNLEPATSSDLQTTSMCVLNGPGIFYGLQINAGSNASASIRVYDSIDTSGITLDYHTNVSSSVNQSQWYSNGIRANKGLYVVITGTGANFVIYYSRT